MTSPSPPPGRYVAFRLGTAHYAVPVTAVREVVRVCPITPVPQMPEYVRGVINLRGTVLAVLDLRAKFRMPAIEYDDRACIIVFDHRTGLKRTQIGTLVDAVEDVVMLNDAHLAPAPDFSGVVEASYLAGVATTGDRVRAVLAMDSILANDATISLPILNTQSESQGSSST